jgi:hypothetical protein
VAKPYKYSKNYGGYFVDQTGLKYGCAGMRPTKNAAGMAYTAARSGHKTDVDLLASLRVNGTADPLARGVMRKLKTPCPCCKGSGNAGYKLRPGNKRLYKKTIGDTDIRSLNQ